MPPKKPKHLLFLDDDPDFLETLEEMLPPSNRNRWRVHTAHDSARALALLRKHPVELVVSDLNMPVVDGLQFLRLLHQVCPEPRKVVLTSNTDETYRQTCLAHGALLYLIKPSGAEGFGPIFRLLNEILEWRTPQGFSGLLRNVSLSDLVQLETISRASSVLQIATGTTCGWIYIQEGRIVHAQAGELDGVDAFIRLVNLESGGFVVQPYRQPEHQTIRAQCESLLLEAAQRRDEETSQFQAEQKRTSEEVTAMLDEQDRKPPSRDEETALRYGQFKSPGSTKIITAAC